MAWGGSFPGQRRRSSNNRSAAIIPSTHADHHHGGLLQNSNNANQVVAANTIRMEEATFLRQAQALIPAEVRMISGCEAEQTSADVANASSSNGALPNPAGRAGGACTSALLKVLYEHHCRQQQQQQQQPLSFQQALLSLRQELANQGFSQIPQLTSSRPLDVGQTHFALAGSSASSASGQRRALLVGINYVGQGYGQLRGCHNDVLNVKNFICQVHGFPERDVLVLMDDGQHNYPTRENIVRALQKLVALSQAGDAVFFHYSGTMVYCR
jgi:metacaspase-1